MTTRVLHLSEEDQNLASQLDAEEFVSWMFETVRPFLSGHVLEIGSGMGAISRHLVDECEKVSLSDIRPDHCETLRKQFGMRDTVAEVLPLDIGDPFLADHHADRFGTYDSIVMLNVLEHVYDDEQALRNCLSLLRPGGTMVQLVPAIPALYNSFDAAVHHHRRYRRSALVRKMRATGWMIASSRYFNAAGILGWFVSGKLRRHRVITQQEMQTYERFLGAIKFVDKFCNRIFGLSAIVIGTKPESDTRQALAFVKEYNVRDTEAV